LAARCGRGHLRAQKLFPHGGGEFFQLAQRSPDELTGMNWLLPMYCSSTADPWLPQRVLVVVVLGCGLVLKLKTSP
jgi:hypothetical protein